MVIWSLCVHCHSHSFARTWTEKRIQIQIQVAEFCHHDHMYLSRVFTGAAHRAEHCTTRAGALELGTVALNVVLFENAGNVFTMTMYQYDYSFGAKGQGVLPKWGDRQLSVGMAHDLRLRQKKIVFSLCGGWAWFYMWHLQFPWWRVLTVYKVEVGVLGKEWEASILKSAKLDITRGWCGFPIPSLTYEL